MRLLHISDLHILDQWVKDQEVVLDAFFHDIESMAAIVSFDLVVFTGDLSFSAAPNELSRARAQLLEPLCDKLGLPLGKVVLVGGNHDIDRNRIDQMTELGLRSHLVNQEAVNDLLDSEDEIGKYIQRSENWIQFTRDFYGEDSEDCFGGLLRSHSYDIGGQSVKVGALSSAWRATGQADDGDRGHLLVGDRQIKEAARRVADAQIRIAAMHHPLDWLPQFDARSVELELGEHFDLLMTGHVHEATPIGVQRLGGGYVHSIAGSLFGDGGRSFNNGYTILDIDPNVRSIDFTLREYQPQRESFDAAVSVAQGGRGRLSLPSINRAASESAALLGLPVGEFFSRHEQASRHLVQRVREQSVLAPEIELPDEYLSPLDELTLYVIDPVLQRSPRNDLAAPAEPDDKALAISDLHETLERCHRVLICGDPDSGLTTATVWLLLQLSSFYRNRIPILLDADAIGAGQHAYERAIQAALAEAGVGVGRDQTLPPLLVGLNDAHKLSEAKLARLRTMITGDSESMFVINTRSSDAERLAGRLGSPPIELPTIYLGSVKRRQLRQMVKRLVPDDDGTILQIVSALAGTNEIGRAPFVLSALIRLAAAEQSLLSVTDATSVTQSYADWLLGRNDRFEDARVSLIYRNREHILANLAKWMFENGDTGVIGRADLEAFLSDYFKVLDWYTPVSHVVDDLVRRWVLFEVRKDQFAFRQKPMQAFFTAKMTFEDRDFRAVVVADPVKWMSVVEYMAGLPKDDAALLRQMRDELPKRPPRGDLFDRPQQVIDGVAIKVDTVADPADGPVVPLDADADNDMDDFLDSMVTGTSSFQLATFVDRADEGSMAIAWTSLASLVLRHSELVPDSDLKHDLFRELVVRWADFCDQMAQTLPALAERALGALDPGVAATSDDELSTAEPDVQRTVRRVLDEIAGFLPMAVGIGYSDSQLATTKLTNSIAALMLDGEVFEDAGAAIVLAALAEQSRVDGWVEYLSRVQSAYPDRRAIRHGVVVVGFKALLANRHGREDREKVERITARSMFSTYTFANANTRAAAEHQFVRWIRIHRRPGGVDVS